SVARVRPGFGRQTLDRRAQSFGTDGSGRIGRAGGGGGSEGAGVGGTLGYGFERQGGALGVVIDDLAFIFDGDWGILFFHRLLLLLPADIHMLILGRGLPPAPMWRLRSKQRLFVITEQMLAFTQTEAEELFSGYGLDPGEASSAIKRTGGRAAGL